MLQLNTKWTASLFTLSAMVIRLLTPPWLVRIFKIYTYQIQISNVCCTQTGKLLRAASPPEYSFLDILNREWFMPGDIIGQKQQIVESTVAMIKIAVVGYGWGPNCSQYSRVRGACVVSVGTNGPAQVKSKYPSIEITTRYEDVLKNPSVDAVAISIPVALHYDFARKALEHGKHVLVEKPVAASVAEAEKLVDLAEKRKLTFMVDHTFIYTGAVRKMKEIVARGDLGDLYYFDSVRINLGLVQHDVNVLWDLAPHDIAILEHLVDEQPASVCANGACHMGNGIENVAYLTVYFNSGLIITSTITDFARKNPSWSVEAKNDSL
jgi:predicted dehydrogenase